MESKFRRSTMLLSEISLDVTLSNFDGFHWKTPVLIVKHSVCRELLPQSYHATEFPSSRLQCSIGLTRRGAVERRIMECFISKIDRYRRIWRRFDKLARRYTGRFSFVGALIRLR